MLYARRKPSKLRGNLNPLPTTDEPAFPCLQAPSCSSYYPSIPAFLAMSRLMQWQVDQSVNRKLPPLPPRSCCMAAASIGDNGSRGMQESRELLLFLAQPPPQRGTAGRGGGAAALLGGSKKPLVGGYLLKKYKIPAGWEVVLPCLAGELPLQ